MNIFCPSEEDKKQILMALESTHITKRRTYCYQDHVVKLADLDYSEAILFTPQALANLEGTWKRDIHHTNPVGVHVTNSDTFDAAQQLDKTLVLNFCNGEYPGGGFLYGASSQEESLCRRSTLYASLTSTAAEQMYTFNRASQDKVGSDHMIFSPNVAVFRNVQGELLEKPFYVSILSVPAPDRAVKAKDVPQSEIEFSVKKRLRGFFMVAAAHGFQSVVLGAWGCGAFGNSPWDVAKAFRELLENEGFGKYFEDIVFAINSPDNEAVFRKVLSNMRRV